MKTKLFFTGLGIIFFIAFYILGTSSSEITPTEEKVLSIGTETILVDIADTDLLRSKGLGGKESLSENSGLLFVFEQKGKYGFWMKDMNFPIDILWFNEEGELVDVSEGVSPESFPDVFYPKEDILYALETNQGEFLNPKSLIGKRFVLSK